MLWFIVLGLCMNSCGDCSGEQTRTKNSVVSLNNTVYHLQNEISLLKSGNSNLQGRVTVLESQLSKSEMDKTQLQEQLEQLRNIKKGFYK